MCVPCTCHCLPEGGFRKEVNPLSLEMEISMNTSLSHKGASFRNCRTNTAVVWVFTAFGDCDLYSVLLFSLSHDGTDSPPDANEVVVILNNFKSKIIKVKVSLLCLGSHCL